MIRSSYRSVWICLLFVCPVSAADPAGELAGTIVVQKTGAGMTLRIPYRDETTGEVKTLTLRNVSSETLTALGAVPNGGRPVAAKPVVAQAPSSSPKPLPERSEGADSNDSAAHVAAPKTPEQPRWAWFTGTDRAFAPLLADQREAQVRFGYMADENSKALIDFGIGGDIVILQGRFGDDSRLTFSGRGLISGRLDFEMGTFPVVNTDYIGGLAMGYQKGPWQAQAYFYHESSHLGDEVLTETNRQRIDYSREALQLLVSRYFFDDALRLYGGGSVNVRADPRDIAGKMTLHAGAEYWFNLFEVPMYVAVDLQSRQQNGWYLNTTAQYGIELGNHPKHRPRIFLEFFNGYSEMGQYWNEREVHGMVGFGYNF